MAEGDKTSPGKRKRRERLPYAGPPLAPFCQKVARSLRAPSGALPGARRIYEDFLAALATTTATEARYGDLRRRVAALGGDLERRRLDLRGELQRVDSTLIGRFGHRSPELRTYGLPPLEPRGGRRKRRRGGG